MGKVAFTIRQKLIRRIKKLKLPVPAHMRLHYDIKDFYPGMLWSNSTPHIVWEEKKIKKQITQVAQYVYH